MGHYKEALAEVSDVLQELDTKHDFTESEKCDPSIEYFFYKLVYFKIKI